MTKQVEVYNGVNGNYIALVDDEDYERVVAYTWYLLIEERRLRATTKQKVNGIWKTLHMHRLILKLEYGDRKIIDHINGNGLDNRKVNLRFVTVRGNALNSDRSRRAKLIERHGKRWRLRPWVNGERLNLGYFDTEEEAQKALQEHLRCYPR